MRKTHTVILTLVMVLVMQLSFAQEKVISGNVSDSFGAPIPGVNIFIKERTDVGTQTDFDGNYTIKADAQDVLVFSYLGFVSQEIPVEGKDVINVNLEAAVAELGEVVVTALGIKRSEKALGFSIQSVKGDDIAKTKESNLINSLSGTIAGVQITNSSGATGASSRITLRGINSLTGNNQPLFVIDGIPIENNNFGTAGPFGGRDLPNGVADIDPSTIESISVLKGPNAAALYGNRGSNGVIIITTKRGNESDKLNINISSSIDFDSPLILPDFQNSYGQGLNQDFFEFVDGQTGDAGLDFSWGPPLDVGLSFVQWNSFDGQPLPWVSQPDNIKDFYDTGLNIRNSITFSGGHEQGDYRLTVSNYDQKGIVPFTDFERTSFSGSFNQKHGEKLTSGVNVQYIKSGSSNIISTGYTPDNPTQQINGFAGRNVDFNALRDWRNLPLAASNTAAAGTPINWNTRFQNNPFWALENNKNTFDKDRLVGGINVNYEFNKNFSATMKVSGDYSSTRTQEKRQHGSIAFPNGLFRDFVGTRLEVNYEGLISFNKDLNEDFRINLNAGGNRLNRSFESSFVGLNDGLEIPGLFVASNARQGTTPVNTTQRSEVRTNSLLGFGQISFREYAFIDFTARNDWDSRLPLGGNSFFYPSVSGSLILTDAFDLKSDAISFLKLRGSWAEVGSTGQLGPSQLEQTFVIGTQFGDVPAFRPSRVIFDPNIKPEKTISTEFGLDARLLKNKVRLDATYYNSRSEDLIVTTDISDASGFFTAVNNAGVIENKGFEISLGATLVETQDFSVDITINYAMNDNEVVEISEGLESITLGGQWGLITEARVGKPYGNLRGFGYARDTQGNIIHENGLPVIDDELKDFGSFQEDWRGGASIGIRYKGLTFSGLIDAKIGGVIHSITNTWGKHAGIFEETLVGRETGIVGTGVREDPNNAGQFIPNDVVVSTSQYFQTAFSNNIHESSIYDASYIKLRQLSLSYAFPQKLLAKTGIDELSIGVSGRNLAILYKEAPHIDPESAFSNANGGQGLESGQIPSVRSIGFNLNLKL
ncbi:SusC/RagA family TonB-linked outer membrane protein [Aquimarina sp. 2201CG5-10]|uniref:SusC/RagA family TonB-linked outer membrane protein n=1 Tax=Aquimarina callyspongiae TaxID=3098150 RepID=UPI002AB3F12E|nr:SusC/RagA family TonB-linked outer membrane protein [Aquimarina sp. 2201CG5-10]MDY8134255.1 SusC/RagA family TonB-linked outer membrane protein [Aquimarina sp. 2201CG5-10]